MQVNEYAERFGLSAQDLDGLVLEYGCVQKTIQTELPGFAQPVTRCELKDECILPFPDFTFDIALYPHAFFVAMDDYDVAFHLKIIMELARVAKEVRITPLTNSERLPSIQLGPVLLGLQQENYGIEVREVPALSHPDGHAMLRVWAQLCRVS